MRNLRAAYPFLCIVAFGLVLLSFTGCAQQGASTGDKPVITVWHWMTDREPAFQELASRYEAQTGIRVQFELYAPSDAYSQKVRAAAQGFNLPDIFGILGEKRDFSSFIKAGHILDLSLFMEEDNGAWRDSLFEKALAVNQFIEGNSYGIAPGTYGVPIDVMAIQMLYNKKLYAQLGFDPAKPPQDFQEFLAVGRKIKEAGMQGLVSGWGEVWMIDCFANNYAFNIMGRDKVLATIRGEVPYTDPDWVRVFTIFKELQEAGVLSNGLVTMINKTAEQLFANERAVFAFNGSWCVNVYHGMNPELEYGAFLPPPVSSEHPMKVWGGAGSSFMVNARSAMKSEAVAFLKWLTAADQQAYLSAATNNLPANKKSLSKIPPLLAQFAKAVDSTTHPNIWGISEFSPVIEAFDKGIQSIIIGEKTPEEVAREVQKIKAREMEKRKR